MVELEYRRIDVRPVTAALGAEVSGVDIATLDEAQFKELQRAFTEFQVVFLREQTADQATFLAFARRWGTVVTYPYMKGLDSHPEILPVLKTPTDTYTFGNQWHSDSSFLAIPPAATILQALDVPSVGGDTLFADMYSAFESLSSGMQGLLANLRVCNSGDRLIARFAELGEMEQTDPGDLQVSAVHPAVRTHPETGRRALYIGSHTVRFDGMSVDESAPLIEQLRGHAARPEFTCRFRWGPRSIAIWDNRCTQHYAVDDYAGHRRQMQRITIAAEEAPYLEER